MKFDKKLLNKIPIKGHFEIERLDEDGNVIEKWEQHNTVVLTGRAWLLSMISGIDKDDYAGNEELWGIALGKSKNANDGTPNTVKNNDWHLTSEGLINEGGDKLREAFDDYMIPPYIEDTRILHASSVFTDDSFPVLPYTFNEIGVFISATPPTADPYVNVDQRPNCMFGRMITPNYGITKYNDGTQIRVKYTLDISESLGDMVSAGWTLLEYEGWNDYNSPWPYETSNYLKSPSVEGIKKAKFNFASDSTSGDADPAGWTVSEPDTDSIAVVEYYMSMFHPVKISAKNGDCYMEYSYSSSESSGNVEFDAIFISPTRNSEGYHYFRIFNNASGDMIELRIIKELLSMPDPSYFVFQQKIGLFITTATGTSQVGDWKYWTASDGSSGHDADFVYTPYKMQHYRINFDKNAGTVNVYIVSDQLSGNEELLWSSTSLSLSGDIDRCRIGVSTTSNVEREIYIGCVDFSHDAGYYVNRSLEYDTRMLDITTEEIIIGHSLKISPLISTTSIDDWFGNVIAWFTSRKFKKLKVKAYIMLPPSVTDDNSGCGIFIGNVFGINKTTTDLPFVGGLLLMNDGSGNPIVSIGISSEPAKRDTWYLLEMEANYETQEVTCTATEKDTGNVIFNKTTPFFAGHERSHMAGIIFQQWDTTGNYFYVDEFYWHGKDEY
ncbi:MAG: hypothetical protein ACTSQ8_09340 [Candidatus Helarchaeota archaeon]